MPPRRANLLSLFLEDGESRKKVDLGHNDAEQGVAVVLDEADRAMLELREFSLTFLK